MSYYFIFMIAFIAIGAFVEYIKQKQVLEFFKASTFLIIAAILAVGVNISSIYHTYEYTKETMRGGSEVAEITGSATKSGGLDKAYITQWSYGIGETFTLLIPNYKGGETGALSQDKTAMKKAKPEYRQYFGQMNKYWGDQPFTSGPVYVGAFVIFLFIFGLFVVKGWLKWVFLASTVFSIVLAWGHNFMILTDLFID